MNKLYPKIWTPLKANFSVFKIFLNPIYFRPKIFFWLFFSSQTFFTLIVFEPTFFFWIQNSFGLNVFFGPYFFFGPKIFQPKSLLLYPTFFWLKNFCWTKNFFWPDIFFDPTFFLPKSLDQNFFITKISFTKILLWHQIFWTQLKKFWSEKILDPKKCWVQKILGLKKFGSKRI